MWWVWQSDKVTVWLAYTDLGNYSNHTYWQSSTLPEVYTVSNYLTLSDYTYDAKTTSDTLTPFVKLSQRNSVRLIHNQYNGVENYHTVSLTP